MKIILDLTDEEIKMICDSLEAAAIEIIKKSGNYKNEEEIDKYYNLAEKFRKSGQKVIYFAKKVEE